jgi:hypothetical protein
LAWAHFQEVKKEKRQQRFLVNRRTFLKLSALTGTVVGGKRMIGPFDPFASLSPQQKTKDPPEEKWISTSCINCLAAIPSGQGHYAYGKWQQGIGVNPHEIIGVDYDHLSGQSAFYNTRVKLYRA